MTHELMLIVFERGATQIAQNIRARLNKNSVKHSHYRRGIVHKIVRLLSCLKGKLTDKPQPLLIPVRKHEVRQHFH